jgi:glycosyltransferase involved in cell wall biosynthesis
MTALLIDVTRLVYRFINKRLPTGVDRVSLAYIRHYGPHARAVLRYNGGKFVFRRIESLLIFDWLLSLGADGSPMKLIYKGLVTGILAQQVRDHILFNTGHNGLETDNYVTMLRQQRVKPIFVLHDLIPLTHPQYCRDGEQAKHLTRIRNAIRVASGIVCNSKATMNALEELCKCHKWSLPSTTVALLASDLPDAAQTIRPVSRAYFVFVSTIEPRKNHLMILKLWERLATQLGKETPQLIIIGQRGWNFNEVTDLLERSTVLKELVIEIPMCSDAEMVNYLQHAKALLFPSFAEGFGMPVVEALVHGVPVIASDLPVFQEFAGNIPEYVDVLDEDRWLATIVNYADAKSTQRSAQLVRIMSFQAPTWTEHFAKVDDLLAEVKGAR